MKIRYIALALLAGASTFGCRSGRPIAATIFLDGSDRTPDNLTAELGLAWEVNTQLGARDTITCYAFGHDVEPLYSGSKFRSRSEFNQAILPVLGNDGDPLWTRGTRTERVLERAAKDCESAGPMVVLIVSDGGMEVRSTRVLANLRDSVTRIDRHHCTTLMLAGVAPSFRSDWISILKPLGRKADVRGFVDAPSGITDLITNARRENK